MSSQVENVAKSAPIFAFNPPELTLLLGVSSDFRKRAYGLSEKSLWTFGKEPISLDKVGRKPIGEIKNERHESMSLGRSKNPADS